MRTDLALFTAVVLAAAGLTGCSSPSRADHSAPARVVAPEACPTTIIIARHGNKEDPPKDPKNPALSEKGEARARRLGEALKDAGVDTVYRSDTARAKRTAELAVSALGLTGKVTEHVYDYDTDNSKVPDLAKRLAAEPPGHVILFVGHSHSIPVLLDRLGGWKVPAIKTDEDRDFDHVFVVTLNKDGSKRLLKLGYPPASK